MERIDSLFHSKFQHHPHRYSSVAPPLTISVNHLQNVNYQPNPAMPLKSLPLRRIATTQFNHRRPISLNCNLISTSPNPMVDESKKIDIQDNMSLSKIEDSKQKESEKSTPVLPPLPEKPLPGDCCGSGCVRCVWDVYYEELEEYDKLVKGNS